jgi:hypothetical protein
MMPATPVPGQTRFGPCLTASALQAADATGSILARDLGESVPSA